MSRVIEFYFDFGSPTAYLAATQLPRIAERHGAHLDWRPVLLGGLFRAAENRSPMENALKARYMLQDLPRFAARYGVELRHNPHFPINTLSLMRGAAGIQMYDPGRFLDYVGAIYRAMWVDGLDMGQPATVARVLAASGLDQVTDWIADPAVKQKLLDDTNLAAARGLFGVPTMFVGDAMFFGQDRLDFVEEEVARSDTIARRP